MENFPERPPNLQLLILVNVHLTSNPHHPAKNCIVLRYVTTCLALHVKQIEIKNFSGKDDRLEIIICYLLKNGRVLELYTTTQESILERDCQSFQGAPPLVNLYFLFTD